MIQTPRESVKTPGTIRKPPYGRSASMILAMALNAAIEFVPLLSCVKLPTLAPWLFSVWLALKLARVDLLSKNVRAVAFVVIVVFSLVSSLYLVSVWVVVKLAHPHKISTGNTIRILFMPDLASNTG